MPVPFRKAPVAIAVGAAITASLPAHGFQVLPAGNEFELAEDSGNTNQQTPDVASADNGSFVAVWADGGEIFAQRFSADGTRQGGEISVPRANALNTSPRSAPVVAADSDGDFAVAWQADYPLSNLGNEIAFQRFDSSGNTVASARRATDDLTGPDNQTNPAIAMDADGDFVIAWQGFYDATDTNDVAYRLFNATSGAATATALAASDSTGDTSNAAVSRAGAGEFAIAWFYDTGGDVFVRRFGSGGAPIALEQPVTAAPLSLTSEPDIAMDDDGDFAVAWEEYALGNYELYYRAFRADGSEFIGQTLVAAGNAGAPAIALLNSDDAVVGWEDNDASGIGVFVSSFGPDGTLHSGPLAVNQATTNAQDQPAIAMDSDGDFVVAFQSYVTSTETDVLARRFDRLIIDGTGGSGTGSLGWLGALGLGLFAAGRRWLGRRRHRRRGGGFAGLLAGTLALGAMSGTPPAEAAEPQQAGRVEQASGEVTAIRPGESARSLAAGNPVYTGDRVRTGAGARAILRLVDGTRVSLREDSVFRVAEIQRRQTEDGGSSLSGMFMDLLRGGLRMITGSVADDEPENYQLHTPVATIGVRGTEFDARLCAPGACPEEAGEAAEGPEPVARVLRVDGLARAEGPNEAVRVLERGAGIFRDDTITTAGDAWAVLQFADDSRVSLQPDTRFRVDEWEFDRADPDEGSALLNLLRGGMRVLTGLIGQEAREDYQVETPVATIGVRGTGFDLLCVGTCVNPDVEALSSFQGDGLLVNTWDGEIVAQLEGRVAGFAAGETGFLANAGAAPLRLPEVPQLLQQLPAPRPDTVTGALQPGSDQLYTSVQDGSIVLQGAQGAPVILGVGEAAVVGAGGAAQPLAATPGVLGDGMGVPAATIAGAFGQLMLAQFDLGSWYAGASAGTASAGSRGEFESRIQDDFPSASVLSLDSESTAGRVYGGFRLLGLLGVEVGYADLGELDSAIDPGAASPAAVAEDALDKHPFTPRGVDVSAIVVAPGDIFGNTRAFGRAGVFTWEAEIETATPTGQKFSKDLSGTDPLVGGGVEVRMAPNVHARAEWIRYELDPDPVDYIGAGVVWTFP